MSRSRHFTRDVYLNQGFQPNDLNRVECRQNHHAFGAPKQLEKILKFLNR